MNRTIRNTTLSMFVGAAVAAVPVAAGTLYGTDDAGDQVIVIDSAAGGGVVLGAAGLSLSATGLAYDTSTGTMYVSDGFAAVDAGLGVVDLTTGAVTFIGEHVISQNIFGLAYDSLDDVLFGSDIESVSLVTLNRATGEATVVGPFSIGGDNINGLAFDPASDTLYGVSDTTLYTIDQAAGTATAVGAHGAGDGLGLEFDAETGALFMADSNDNLFVLNTANGAASLVGAIGLEIDGLASVPTPASVLEVPAPGAWGLGALGLLLGGAALSTLRRRNTTPRTRLLHLALPISFAATAVTGTPPTPPSHLNQPVLEHVVLEGFISPDGRACSWSREGVNGPPYPAAFLVPAGRRLVVTDVEWQVYGDKGAFSAADSLWVEIRLTDEDGPNNTRRVFLSRTLPGLGQALVGASEQTTTGFTVAPKTSMCAMPFGANSAAATHLTIYTILLHGYLIGAGNLTVGPTP